MEFDPKEATTDEAHLLAQTRKVVLQPADPFLRPEDTPDPIVATETRVVVESESENTSDGNQLIKPSQSMAQDPKKSVHHHPVFKVVVIALSLVGGVVAGILYFLFLG